MAHLLAHHLDWVYLRSTLCSSFGIILLSSYYLPSDQGSFFVSPEEQADAIEHISYPAGSFVLRPEPGVELNWCVCLESETVHS